MKLIFRIVICSTICATLLSLLIGCGGGGGASSGQASPLGSSGTGNLPSGGGGSTTNTRNLDPNSDPSIATVINGTVTFPSNIDRSASKVSSYRRHFALSSVNLVKPKQNPLTNVNVELWVTKNSGDGLGQKPILRLDDSLTDANGSYQLYIPKLKLTELSNITGDSITSIEKLYQSTAYRLEIKMVRPASGSIASINKKVKFRPSHNNRPIGGDSLKPDLTVNAIIDFNNSSNLSLEIINTQELTQKKIQLQELVANPPLDWDPSEWLPEQLTERLVIKENVDLDGNGLPDELTPLVLFEKPLIENDLPKIINRRIVRVFELDTDDDGNFAESEDLTSATIFGGDPNSSNKVASFVDIESDGLINQPADITGSQLDTRLPLIEFVQPISDATVNGDLNIQVRFCDCESFVNGQARNVDLGYDISTLRVWFAKRVEFLSPSRFSLLPNTDIAQAYFSKVSDGGTSGTASFILKNVNFAFGSQEFNHTIYASIKDFAGKERITSVNFVVNGPPQIQASNEYIVSEGSSTFTTRIIIRDVDTVDVSLEMISGEPVPDYIIYLTADDRNDLGSVIPNLVPINDRTSLYLNVVPGFDFGLRGNQILLLKVNDGTSTVSKPITLRARKTNTPSNFIGICWVNDANVLPHPFSANPQNVCTVIGTNQEDQFCRINESKPLEIPENELAQFVLCGSELDSEDLVFYSYQSIKAENALTASTVVPQFNSEFFFKKPYSLNYYFNAQNNSILPTIGETQSSIGAFEWKPLGNAYPNQNTLTFRASDGRGVENCIDPLCQPSEDISIILSVTTVQDPPEIISVSTEGQRAGTFPGSSIYADPSLLLVENNSDFFEKFRTGSNSEVLFKAQQDEFIQIEFTANDDETPTGSTRPTLVLVNAPQWLQVIPISPRNNYKLRIGGTPTREDSLKKQSFTIETQDPTDQAKTTFYTFYIEILDQNDKPYFHSENSEALLTSPVSANFSETVTLSIDATEDLPLVFYVHAHDIDPVASPYFGPEKFSFLYENASFELLGTKLEPIVAMEYETGKSYRSARIRWTPRSRDTGENQAAGVAARKQNRIVILGTANCPTDSNLIEFCQQKVNSIDVRINVLSVDEPAHFQTLTRGGVQIFEPDGSIHKTSIIELQEGVDTVIKQFALDEENQRIDSIKINSKPSSLGKLAASAKFFANVDPSQPSHIELTGAPSIGDYVNTAEGVEGSPVCSVPLWTQPNVESVCTPEIVTMELEVLNSIAATGAQTSEVKILNFQIVDVADPLVFVEPDTHNPASRSSNNNVNKPISGLQAPTATEDKPFELKIAAFNQKDKNPQFWDGFNFEIIKFPEPRGNMSIQSNLNNTTATTATIFWNPTQEHVSGTGSKQHEIIVRACIRNPESQRITDIIESSCNNQIFRINVLPTNDPPKILFGEQRRDLTLFPFTASNPFIVFEDSIFERLIRVEDEDLQDVNLQVSFRLSSTNPDVNTRTSGESLVAPEETIIPADSNPVTQPGTNFVEQIVSWTSIDWDDISLTSTIPQFAATYILNLTANTPDDNSITGKTTTEVYLEVRSVPDVPRFTTRIIENQIEQGDPPGPIIDFFDIIYNEEGDDLVITLVDKGSASNFLADVNENQSGDQTHVLSLTVSPGQNGVGQHKLQVEVVERENPENFEVVELTLIVKDSNDPPQWEVNPLFDGKFPLQEGQSKIENLFALDADLFSNPDSEKLTFTVKGSFDPTFTTSDLLFSHGQNYASTASMSFIGTTQPPVANSDRQAFNFNFTPLRVTQADPFAVTTYYLQFTVTDQFLTQNCATEPSNCPLSATTTVAFEITPKDDPPAFSKVNSIIIPNKKVIPVCFNTSNDCANQSDYISLASYDILTFSVTAIDQETEPLAFKFTQLDTQTNVSSVVSNLLLSDTPISLTSTNPNTPDSIKLTFTPTNGNVGMERFTLKVQDTSDSSGSSRNSTRLSTRTFAMLISNTADAPTLETVSHKGQNVTSYVTSAKPIIFYEDIVNELLINIDDLDLHIPKSFTAQERTVLSSSYDLSTTEISALESKLFPPEFFSYSFQNRTTYSGLQILNNANDTLLFQFASPANISVTSTTDVVRLSWVPTTKFTFPEVLTNGGNIDLEFLVRSYSSNSTVSTKPTSYATNIRIKVYPVNDKPKILNTETEALATQDSLFTFEIIAQDEEESNLEYKFKVDPLNGMKIKGNKIEWTPNNDNTEFSFYDLELFARDSGAVSRESATSLPKTTPLSSDIYKLRVFLNDIDDPARRDASVVPPTETDEDELYTANLYYEDIDFRDVLKFSLDVKPDEAMEIQDDLNGTATIRWDVPRLPGTYDVVVRVDSVNNNILRSSVYYPYSITVNPVNDPPVFVENAPLLMVENEPYLYNIEVSDEDDSSISLELQTSPVGSLLCDDPTNYVRLFPSDRKLQGTTDLAGKEADESQNASGLITSFTVCIRATDGVTSTIYDFPLSIQASNNAPTIRKLETFNSYPSGIAQTQKESILLVDDEPLIYSAPSTRKVTLYEGYDNHIRMTFDDEEGDNPFSLEIIEGPSALISRESQTDSTETWKLSYKPGVGDILNPPTFKIRVKDTKRVANGETIFVFQTNIIDTPNLPICTFKKTKQLIDEDHSQTLNLNCSDSDLSSTLSYSIVSNPLNPHPSTPIFSSNVLGNTNLELEINNQGLVTFLAKVSEPKQVPVTFSICGTSRSVSAFSTDCVTNSFIYEILDRNDEPVFIPSIPPTIKTTAAEGLLSDGYGYRAGIIPGLTFRFVQSSNPCPPETSQEICVRDEESKTDADLNSAKVSLSIKVPEIAPAGMILSPYTQSCYPRTPTSSCIVGTKGNYRCSTDVECSNVSSKLTFVQTLTWNNIDFTQPSILNLEIEAQELEDPSKNSTFNFSLQIINTNREPYFNNRNPLNPEQVIESDTFIYNLAAITSEDDNDPVSYSIVRGVSGMTINTNTGLVSWTPNVSHIGDHLVQYRVIDLPNSGDSLSYTTDHRITVRKRNNPPFIDPALRKKSDSTVSIQPIATEGKLFEAQILAKDEEGDDFSFKPSLSSLNGAALPEDFNLTSFGSISWIPNNSNVGSNKLIVVVEDTASEENSSQTFDLSVKNVNNPPVITQKITGTQSTQEKQKFTRNLSAIDPDSGDILVYSVDAAKALSATITNTGILVLIPAADAAGSYTVTVSVRDSKNAIDSNSFTLVVSEKNNPPVIEPVAEPLYVNRFNLYTEQLYATDPENDPVTYSFVAKPEGVEIDQNTGLLTILPNQTLQTQEFQVLAKDSLGQSSNAVPVKLQFTENVPPRVTSIPIKVGRVLTPYSYEVKSDAVNYSVKLIRGPLGMTIPQNSKVLNWTPNFDPDIDIDQSGVHIVEVRVQSDVNGETLESKPHRYLLTINKENEPPVLEYVRDLNNAPISTYDALQGAAFFRTVLKLSDDNTEDLNRLDFYFANTNKSKTATSNSKSQAIAQLTEKPDSARIENGKAIKELELLWTPDNGAAFAVANGQNNRFTIIASDGITESTSITIDFNVTNVNDAPVLFADENQGGTEIGFVDKVYTKDFFARDIDNQKVYFCFDTSKFSEPGSQDIANKYPSPLPIDILPQGNVLNDRGILKFTGVGETIVNGNLPANHICTEGQQVLDDPKPDRGKLHKATLVWTPDDTYIEREPYQGLPLTLYDGISANSISNAFNLKLAPIINNLVPDIQYIGEPVSISGGGIVSSPNELNVKFIRSDGSISAVTQVFDLSIRGKGKFIVPNGATSGFISVGFTSFSSPVPFTVLNGKTSTLVGSTREDQDLLSIPAGIASTYVDSNTAIIFVSNRDYHCVQAYRFDHSSAETVLIGVISGQLGYAGDYDGDQTLSQLNNPTGLSLAYYQANHYLIVADTLNNKIKAVNVSDLVHHKLYDGTWSTSTYTIAESKHLNRPYKAIQHTNPTSSNYFYIANTFGNTIELLYTGDLKFSNLTEREPNEGSSTYSQKSSEVLLKIGDANVIGSRNTYTVAGSGHARNDILGNVFHPVDLQIVESGSDYQLLVSNYSNYKYSFNSSFRLYKGKEADRNARNSNNIATPQVIKDFSIDSISLAKYGPETMYDGEVLLVGSSNHNSLITTRGMKALKITTKVNQTDLGKFYITGPDTYYTEPKTRADNLNQATQETHSKKLDKLASRQQTLYQTYELEFSTSVTDSTLVSNPSDPIDRAAAYIKYDTKEVVITQLDQNGFYAISGAILTTFPAEIGNKPLGIPTYYDTNRDGVADLWLPVPDLGKVFIFPGEKGTFPNPPIRFNMKNYWYINSASIDAECEAINCLRGVNKAAFGRIVPMVGPLETNTSSSIVRGEDLILLNPFAKSIYLVEGYAWTFDGTATGSTAVNTLPDNRFHIDRDPNLSFVKENMFLPLSGSTAVTFRCDSEQCFDVDGTPLGFPYWLFRFDSDSPPEDVCVGSYSMHPFQAKCKFGGEESSCESDPETDAAPSDIEYDWKLGPDTTPTFEEMKEDLKKLEQMVITFSPATGQKAKPVSLIILRSGAERTIINLPVSAETAPQCGEPITRPDLDLRSLKYSGIDTDHQAWSQATLDERKVDSVFYVDGNGKFQKVYFQDSTVAPILYGVPTLRDFATEASQIKLPDGKAVTSTSDFVLVDVNGDGVKDLISIHPTERKLIITVGTNNPAGALFTNLNTTDSQALDTLENPVSISLMTINKEDSLRDAPHIVDIVVTNQNASSVTVFEHLDENQEQPGSWFKPGVSFEVGDFGNRFGATVIETESSLTVGKGEVTTYANIVWDRYYYGNHTQNKYFHTGVRETEYSTKGYIGIQANPARNSSVMIALPLTSSVIFRSTRGFGVTTDPEKLVSVDLNRDGIKDLVILDPNNGLFSTILSNSTTALTYDPNADYYLTERTGGIAFGDMDQRKDLDEKFTTDVLVSNFDKSSITIYYNGGVPLSPDTTSNFSFSHPDFAPKTLSVGRGPRGLTVADLNLDGVLDIAVANQISDNVSVLYGKKTNPISFEKPVFYSVDNSPISVIAMPVRTHINTATAILDLVAVNEDGESITVLLNKSIQGTGINGFEKPRTVKIAEYSPSHVRIIEPNTGKAVNPFNESPFLYESGDFGNLTSYTASILQTLPEVTSQDSTYLNQFTTETLRYENLVVAYRSMIYNLKNIGDKQHSAHRSSLSSFTINSDSSLSLNSMLSFSPESSVKSMFTSSDGFLYYVVNSISDRTYTLETATNDSLHTASALYKIDSRQSLLGQNGTLISNDIPYTTNFNILNEELGAGFEAISLAPNSAGTSIFAIHSGENKGILKLSGSSSANFQSTFIVNIKRQDPEVSNDSVTELSENVQLFRPGGMTIDFNNLSLLTVDRGNEFIRITDLKDSVTRTMQLYGIDKTPKLTKVVAISNQKNTFNYYAITSDRKLYLINPSDSPITVTTQIFESNIFLSPPHSNLEWFEVKSSQDFLYIAARNNADYPTDGYLYKINLLTSPKQIEIFHFDSGINGIDVDSTGEFLYFSEPKTYQIKKVNLSVTPMSPETLVGLHGLSGHYDGGSSIALINKPRDVILNRNGSVLYFIDGSCIRSINLDDANSGEYETATIAGDPFRTGILNSDGQRTLFIKPAYLHYEFRNGKDVLYIADEMAHNIRRVEVNP